ncbi:hypothetical protein Nepgr_009640 [Nepenthes gracilis]|uniref:Glabrous enhancer-binding protein-like DBD domain-containing protein n=1 Tax=Nepenthes gracilis TaxID=150966 RepID=A0AAD3XKJ3_NEPGR|nr:hypothetical protein Nepgr_009640 [Nepenthes gracilis]
MALEEDHTVYNDDVIDDDDDNEPLNDVVLDEDEEDEEDVVGDDNDDFESDTDTNSTSSAIPISSTAMVDSSAITLAIPAPVHNGNPPSAIAASVTAAMITSPVAKRQRVEDTSAEKRPLPPIDDSRRLFQRLWTDEDEIELLQGFLDYTTQRGMTSCGHHRDTAAFYDQIKSKFQLDFNKNQLVEKLRRLKKKYRNVVNRISSGKEFAFKSAHDQATFEISRKIWSNSGILNRPELDDDDQKPNLSSNSNNIPNSNLNENSDHKALNMDINMDIPKSRKRSRGKAEEKGPTLKVANLGGSEGINVVSSMQGLIEETVRSCLSPMLKELMNDAVSGTAFAGGRGTGGMALNATPLNFACMNSGGSGDVMGDKWRKQQILELEVYSKRLELVQDQIKSTLEELRSMGGS